MTIAPSSPVHRHDEHEVSRHKCLIYDGHPSEQLPVIVPLLLDGLTKHERCLYLGAPSMVGMIEAALASAGVNVAAHLEQGSLILSSDRPPGDGAFDPVAMVAMLESLVDAAVADGYAGLVATGDMRWELGGDANFARLLEYESLLEQVFPRKPLRGICQYHRDTVPAAALQDAFETHSQLYVGGGGLARENLFYIPPELRGTSRERRAELGAWMYQQLSRIMAAEAGRDQARAALEASNKHLEAQVKDRTAKLEAVNRELEAFSYSVSHDLRAPVRHIDGFAKILETDYGQQLGPSGLGHLRRVRDANRRMSDLIDGMLTLGQAGKQAMLMEDVDVSTLAGDVATELLQAEPGRRVVFDIAKGMAARGDATLLRAVLQNLLGNAWKFTSGKDDARISLDAMKNNQGLVVFRVADNGAGFDMQHASKLFGTFERLHKQEEFPGTGVGLATVARIVQRHGGRVWAEAALGKGATFYFSLPGANGSN